MRMIHWIVVASALALSSSSAQELPGQELPWDALRQLESERRWAEVESLAVVFVRQLEARAAPDSSELGRALLHRAQAAWEQRRHGEPGVVEALERSIALQARHDSGGGVRLPWSHLLAARVLYDLARADRALDHARTASSMFASIDRPDTIYWADAELYVGLSCVALARPVEARAGYARSLGLREAKWGADSPRLVPALAEYAMMLTEQGDFDDARSLLVRAERLAARMDVSFNNFLMETLARRSTLEARAGNLAESIDFAERASEGILERWGADSPEFARARVRLAYRLEEFGDHAGEARILREAVPVLDRALGPEHPHVINARVAWLTASLETGDTVTVARELPAVRDALRAQSGSVNRSAFYVALLESQFAQLRGDLGAARSIARRALALESAEEDLSGRSHALAIGAQLRTCTLPSDRALTEELGEELDALAARTTVDGTKEWIEVMALRARAEMLSGSRERAWHTARAADDLARDWFRYEVQALPDERALQLSSRIGEASEVLVSLARSAEEVEIAWDRLVQWRGLVAAEIARRRPASAAAGDASVVAAHAEWMQAQRRLAQRVVSGSMQSSDAMAADALDSAKARAEAAERAYVRVLRDAVDASGPVTLRDVRARLRSDQVLVAFARGSEVEDAPVVQAFIARGTENAPRRVELGDAAVIEGAIARWRAALVAVAAGADPDASEAEARSRGAVVRSLVWDRLVPLLGGAREIFLVPEKPVTELPWLALPVGDERYLAEEPFVLRVLDAERALFEKAHEDAGTGLLAIGAPDFDGGAGGAEAGEPVQLALRSPASPCLTTAEIVLEDLPASRAEVDEIVRIWSSDRDAGVGEVLTGSRANELDVKRRMPGRAVVHLATHGILVEDGCARAVVSPETRGVGGVAALDEPTEISAAPVHSALRDSPWLGRRVWLALAGANRARSAVVDENEGMLTAEEIVTLDLRGTQWVVLSACDTGVGEAWAREGLLGLRRAFHLAGARAVIASQWPVADDATREWMNALYRARAEATSAGGAVQFACREVLAARRTAGRSTHPFFWAAFAATGS